MAGKLTRSSPVSNLFDILLPVVLVGFLIALNVQLLMPFVGLLLWTVILAICFYPIHRRLLAAKWSSRLSATVIGTSLAAFILVPTAIAAVSAASSVPPLVAALKSGEQTIPGPPARLASVPIVGASFHTAWNEAATDLPGFARKFRPQLAGAARWLVGQAGGILIAVLGLTLAVVLAAVTLAYSEKAHAFTLSLFARVTGGATRGQHYMSVIGATVRSVANGVIGVAFVQALLCGLGFFVIGVPGAGLLSLVAMGLGVLQVPVVLVTLPAVIWAFAVKSTTVAIIFTVWSVIAGLSDAVLKPLMIGHGLEVPMPIILLGVIGGVIAYGLVGLFIGAVLLAVGYVLFREWLNMPSDDSATG